jgi:hypothetical protein
VVSGPPVVSPPTIIDEGRATSEVEGVMPMAVGSSANPWAHTVVDMPVEVSSASPAPLAIVGPHPRPSATTPAATIPESKRGEFPLWRQPAVVAIPAILLAIIWASGHFLSLNRQKKAVPPPATKHEPAKPQVTLMELQLKAIDVAEQNRAAGDLAEALRVLQEAASLNGPLNGAIQKQMDAVQAEMKDQRLGKLRQQEEQWWQSAKSDTERGHFPAAQNYLNQILALPEGGLKKDDARKYLDQVIPQRKEEETDFAKVKRELRKKDQENLKRATVLLDRVIQFQGPRKLEAMQLRQTVQSDLITLQKQHRDQQVASLEAGARLDTKQRDFSSARQKMSQIREAGGDTTSLSAEIDQAEAAEQTQRQYENNYLQTVQKYKQALAANDKGGVEAARASFQLIAQGGGSHANDASKYLSEINGRSTPSAAAPTPVVRQDLSSTRAQDESALRELISRYEQAFQQRNIDALRAIWPGIDNKRYDKLKSIFSSDIALGVLVQVEVRSMGIQISPDGQRATITALLFQKHTPKNGATKSRQDETIFHLGKTNGTWVINDVQ